MAFSERAARPPHPVVFEVEYPERLSRLTTLFRLIMAIPQWIVVYLLLSVLWILTVMAWFAILFTGRYPKSFFEFSQGMLRWSANVMAYTALLRDEYPPFATDQGKYPVTLEFDRAERQSRLRLFIRTFAIIPNAIVLSLVQLAWYVTTMIAWFTILFTGRYPRGLFKFSAGVLRWATRQQAYMLLLRDEYPPYSVNANARPGNEALSAVLGLPLLILLIGVQFLPFVGMLRDDDEVVLVASSLYDPGALASERPTGESNGIRLTLVGFGDPAPPPPGSFDERKLAEGRYVEFQVRSEKEGAWPALFSGYFMSLEDCSGAYHGVEHATGDLAFHMYWRGGEDEGSVTFWLPEREEPCALTYYSGLGTVQFVFY